MNTIFLISLIKYFVAINCFVVMIFLCIDSSENYPEAIYTIFLAIFFGAPLLFFYNLKNLILWLREWS